MDFPNVVIMPTHISSVSKYSNQTARNLTDGGNSWTSAAGIANQQWLVPLILPAPYLVASFFVCFGTTPGTANFDCAIYAAPTGGSTTMTRIMSTGATACVNTSNNVQIVAPSGGAKLLDKGSYYMGYVTSSTTTTICHTLNSISVIMGAKNSGVCFGSAAATFGTTTTQSALPTGTLTNKLPLFGISRLASGY
jgi:hypothetical protein